MPVFEENASIGRKVHLKWIDGTPVIVSFLSVDGVLPEHYKEWTSQVNFIPNIKKIAPSNATYTILEVENGHTCFHGKVTSGVPLVSARSMISTLYQTEVNDEIIFINSVRGNEQLREKYKDIL